MKGQSWIVLETNQPRRGGREVGTIESREALERKWITIESADTQRIIRPA